MLFYMIQFSFFVFCMFLSDFIQKSITNSYAFISSASENIELLKLILPIKIVSYLIGLIIFIVMYKKSKHYHDFLKKQNQFKIFMGLAGVALGGFISIVLSLLYFSMASINSLSIFGAGYTTFMMLILGGKIGYESIDRGYTEKYLSLRSNNLVEQLKNNAPNPKIIDTSVIIDGRIKDIIETGFITGDIVIPSFILRELRHISDSSDPTKRAKGRLGLDVLDELRNIKNNNIVITEIEYQDEKEVDMMLLRLATDIGGSVITNDYNLNKVAKIKNVKVLNINDLSNAIKPISIPGDKMIVTVVKQGKDENQGVAYLDDGTMIVVEDGREFIGTEIEVFVTSVLQTSAGRMIFVKPTTK